MGVLLLAALVVLVLFGVGFAVHLLWWIAIIALVIWVIGFFARSSSTGGSRGRWYRW